MCAPNVSLDIDGCLANYVRSYTRIGHKLFGTPVCDTQSLWDHWDSPELQLSKSQCDIIRGEILASPYFWAYLDPLNQSVMYRIERYNNRIFITKREGLHVHQQTVKFLERWWISHPVVYVAKDKAAIAKARNVVAHLDDCPRNCLAMKSALPDAYIALLSQLYNQSRHDECRAQGIVVVYSVDQFCTAIESKGLVV